VISLDPERLRGALLPARATRWTADDVLLYHLAIGAGTPPTDPRELAYAYEEGLQVLPSFGVVPAVSHLMELMPTPVLGLDLTSVLHGEQEVELEGPLPHVFEGTTTARVAGVHDKGSGALVVFETSTTGGGREVAVGRSRFFVRGAGGFGGEPGPSSRTEPPAGPPAWVATVSTLPQQALLYRLTGDRNPLHADPEFARASGFERPILHGMCTYGAVCKTAIVLALDNDATRVRGYRARFAGAVYPGESLRVSVWPGEDALRVEATVVERDAPALTNGVLALG
jgi:acyl dehydratase